MGAITSLLNSEKAIIGVLLIIGSTVLTALGHMTVADWTSYTQWIFGIYVAGKAIQGGTTVVANAIASKPAAPAQPATNVTTNNVVTAPEPA